MSLIPPPTEKLHLRVKSAYKTALSMEFNTQQLLEQADTLADSIVCLSIFLSVYDIFLIAFTTDPLGRAERPRRRPFPRI